VHARVDSQCLRLLAYVEARVDKTPASGCWVWCGSRYGNGYGRIRGAGLNGALAHRVAWELWRGPIPDGLVIDHLCKNRECVNPDHLEPVTQRENVMRSDSLWAEQAKRTHCPDGHSYDEANTAVRNGSRHCRECRKRHQVLYHAKNREKRRAACRARYYAKTGRTPPEHKRDCGPRWEGSKAQAALAKATVS
jgi:hypothetical protein